MLGAFVAMGPRASGAEVRNSAYPVEQLTRHPFVANGAVVEFDIVFCCGFPPG
jgi:hypothetical protein